MVGIRDLARHLEISTGTVSRALNDKTDVNPLTRQRVREAAARLGYSPNQSGRSLRRGRTDLAGVIIPTGSDDTLINQVFLWVLDGLRRELAANGRELAIFLQGDHEEPFASLRSLTERRLVDSVIISDTLHVDPRIDYLIQRRRPFVTFGRSLSGGAHSWVDPDFEGAVHAAIQQLVAHGHRDCALILPDLETQYVHLIEAAFHAALKSRKLQRARATLHKGPASEAGGRAALEAVLSANSQTTALLVTSAAQAAGLYRKLADLGLQPGRDISIIGLLPDAKAKLLVPALAQFQPDWAFVGTQLGKALMFELEASAALPVRGRSAASHHPSDHQPTQILVPTTFLPGPSLSRAPI